MAENQIEILNPSLRVAVASYEGILVNQHLGMAESLYIFEVSQAGFRVVDKRRTPPAGTGDERWHSLSGIIEDCSFLLADSVGPNPLQILSDHGILVFEIEGLIEDALLAIYQGRELRMPHRKVTACRRSVSGTGGQGC